MSDLPDITQLIASLYEKWRKPTIDKSSWLSASGMISKITVPFDKMTAAQRVADREGFTVEQVLQSWELEGKMAIDKGNVLHRAVKSDFQFINKGEYTTLEQANILAGFAKKYIEDIESRGIIKEGFLSDSEYRVYGYFDYLHYDATTKQVVLTDWKTNKKIDVFNRFENFLQPITSLNASKLNIYSLQLNFYKFIIEKNTNIKIDRMEIVHINGKDENYRVIPVGNMQLRIKKILNYLQK